MYNHYVVMFFIMMLSGLLSTMSVWADKADDMRWSLNDFYMMLLMSGWMLLFMGLIDTASNVILIGFSIVVASLWCIRTQFMVSDHQYIKGMIPHHSMAVLMSKKRIEDGSVLTEFARTIVEQQEKEIQWMKRLE